VSDRPPVITLLTDFGDRDAYVGVMKGVILGRAPDARIVDLTHRVAPQNVSGAAYLLETAIPWFPPETIHVAVVDPTVGTDRVIVAVRTARGVFLAPDNGLLTPVLEAGDLRESVRVVGSETASATFHGRDVFAPSAARIATGGALSDLGPPMEPAVTIPDYRAGRDEFGAVVGRVIHVDRFGNAISTIRESDVPDRVRTQVSARGRLLGPAERTYADVAPGAALALFGSAGHLEIAVRDGSAAETLGLRPGDPVVVTEKETHS